MDSVIHPHPAALLQSAERQYVGVTPAQRLLMRMRRSQAMASVLPVFLTTGLVTAIAVAALQLSWLGAVQGFAAQWLENWLVVWAIAFPVAYVAGPLLQRLAGIITAQPDQTELAAMGSVDTQSSEEPSPDASGWLAARQRKALQYARLGVI